MSDFKQGVMMTCGCAATALIGVDGGPDVLGCGLHLCTERAATQPDLTGRTAVCSYGSHSETPSTTDLAFFVHRPNQKHDQYYCGCYGWD